MNNQEIIVSYLKFQKDLKNVKYKDSIVGILDILGFKNAIKNEDEESLKVLQKIMASELFMNTSLVSLKNININMLSDTFIVSSENITSYSVMSVITILENIRRGLMNNGFLCRGSVVSGKHFFKDEILISPAFIRTYEIEEKEAIYPRIIIENALVDLLEKSEKNEKEIFFPKCIIEKDFDGYFVVRPFIQIPEVAFFCEEESSKKELRTDDFQRLVNTFKNQIDIYHDSVNKCLLKIDKKNSRQVAKINYAITKYNELLELCKFYKEKNFLDEMKIESIFNMVCSP